MWNIYLNLHLKTVTNKQLQLDVWHLRDSEYHKNAYSY
jgi:hypothetical protein